MTKSEIEITSSSVKKKVVRFTHIFVAFSECMNFVKMRDILRKHKSMWTRMVLKKSFHPITWCRPFWEKWPFGPYVISKRIVGVFELVGVGYNFTPEMTFSAI